MSVVVPWRGGCEHREASWRWLQGYYADVHPTWQIVQGDPPDGPWCKPAAILDGASRADGQVIVVVDADVWCDNIADAVTAVDGHGWAVPHLHVTRLDAESSRRFRDGQRHDLSTVKGNEGPGRYRGYLGGGIVALRRDVLSDVPPDVRFLGWGQEDEAWALALGVVVGQPWRGTADLFHLWHPPQQRHSRVIGSAESKALLRRYRRASVDVDAMRALIAELSGGGQWTRPDSCSSAAP